MEPYSIFNLFLIDLCCCFSVSWTNRMDFSLIKKSTFCSPSLWPAWDLPYHLPSPFSCLAHCHPIDTQVVGTFLTVVKRILSRPNVQDCKVQLSCCWNCLWVVSAHSHETSNFSNSVDFHLPQDLFLNLDVILIFLVCFNKVRNLGGSK